MQDGELKIDSDFYSVENGVYLSMYDSTGYFLYGKIPVGDKGCTICNRRDNDFDGINTNYYFDRIIYGYENSTAQTYAEKYGYTFESLSEDPFVTTPAVTTAVTTTQTTINTTTTEITVDTTEPSDATIPVSYTHLRRFQ